MKRTEDAGTPTTGRRPTVRRRPRTQHRCRNVQQQHQAPSTSAVGSQSELLHPRQACVLPWIPPPPACDTTTVLVRGQSENKRVGGAFLARCVRCPDCTESLGWNRHSTGPKTLIYGEALGPHSSDRGPTLSACLIRYRGMVSIIARLAPCNRVPFST